MSFEQVKGKVVRCAVTPQRAVLSRRGAMLGYTGSVQFRPVHGQGTGVRGAVGAALSSETVTMMAAEGSGSVLYGHRGLNVTVLELRGDVLVVEADRLLAHDADLQTSVQFLGQGGLRNVVARRGDRAGPVHHQRARLRRGRPALARRHVRAHRRTR